MQQIFHSVTSIFPTKVKNKYQFANDNPPSAVAGSESCAVGRQHVEIQVRGEEDPDQAGDEQPAGQTLAMAQRPHNISPVESAKALTPPIRQAIDGTREVRFSKATVIVPS
ncbi:hypothetical protein [Alistipes megaguti]|uniref:hypothetical protein n=1 Tax=Alistipes megaguti TaxID=2364787 RepID=UPI0023569C02|nr:hypothetical protein [Alistipes megaguti]